ncbi:MAG: FtsQ-type POTRA domain-containing protein [Chitinivibrionales bacterium]|nr:FtsQ-type POTRA domain-containing protein [Chitinivibrionales bacterium]
MPVRISSKWFANGCAREMPSCLWAPERLRPQHMIFSGSSAMRKKRYSRKNTRRRAALGGAAKKRSSLKKRFALYPGLALLIAGCVVASYSVLKPKVSAYIRQNEMFTIKTIEIGDTQRVDKSEMLKASGLHTGMHMIDVDKSSVRKRLEAFAWVKKATVMRKLPDKIRIDITERTPIAYLGDGDVSYIDNDGIVLPPTAGAYAGFPLVYGLKTRVDSALNKHVVDAADLFELEQLLQEFRKRKKELPYPVSQVDLRDCGIVGVMLAGHATLIEIDRSATQTKLDQLCRLFGYLDEHADALPAHINLCHHNLAFVQQ